jgi:hypothetical protein
VNFFANFEKDCGTFDNEKGCFKKTIVHNYLEHAKGFKVLKKTPF